MKLGDKSDLLLRSIVAGSALIGVACNSPEKSAPTPLPPKIDNLSKPGDATLLPPQGETGYQIPGKPVRVWANFINRPDRSYSPSGLDYLQEQLAPTGLASVYFLLNPGAKPYFAFDKKTCGGVIESGIASLDANPDLSLNKGSETNRRFNTLIQGNVLAMVHRVRDIVSIHDCLPRYVLPVDQLTAQIKNPQDELSKPITDQERAKELLRAQGTNPAFWVDKD